MNLGLEQESKILGVPRLLAGACIHCGVGSSFFDLTLFWELVWGCQTVLVKNSNIHFSLQQLMI
jgi:hypothetical protein